MKHIISLLVFCCITIFSFGSHLPGGNITYECVGPNQYLLTLTLFEDCGTAFLTSANQTVTITNDCGLASPVASLPNVVFQEEVSQLCDAQLMNSECNGGTLPGIFMHTWQGVITLPAACDSWTFSYSNCCRNNSNNLTGTPNFYFETTMNSATEPCNNSPAVTTQMIPYVCVNQPVTYNLGVYEPDGHTLVYSLVNALTGSGASVPYAGGFSGGVPIPGIAINSLTGDLTFTSTVIGNYVVSVLVEEYNSNGDLVGTLTQDFQFEVINCPANTNPVVPAGISNYTGDGVLISTNEIEMCVGDAFCFELEFTDLNATDSIYITSNLTQALPGATFTQLTYNSPARAQVCWTASSTVASPTSVVFTARDNACPMFGVTFYPIIVNIITSTYAGPDQVLCAGDSAEINVTGGEQFTWEALPGGDTIIVGNTFSCDTCADVFAVPSLSTTYVVTSDLSGNCVNTDTVTVDVVPDFAYTLTQSSNASCIGSDVFFSTSVSPSGAYVYNWTPADDLDNPNIPNPVFTPTAPGTYEFALEILGPTGCIKYDTLNVNVAAAFVPDFSINVSPTSIICGDTVNLTTTLNGGNPSFCGLSVNTSCSSPSADYTIGAVSGQNTATSYPAPFGNWYRNAKHQLLYTATELNAMGMSGGKITNIAFEVLQLNGDSIYRDYSISMGCTSSNSLTFWESGLSQVFSPQNVQIVAGINDFVLTSAYEWDGISNIVVELCYDNLTTNFTQNSVTPWSTTAFSSCLYYRSDATLACTYNLAPTAVATRPIIRFSSCSTVPDPANYSFEWIPGTDVDDPAAQNSFALPNESGDISMVVTDLNGGCTDTATVALTVQCCTAPDPNISDVFCFGGSNGSVELTPNSYTPGPYFYHLYDTGSGMLVQWDSTAMGNTMFSGLPSGIYQATFEDQTGCTSDTTFTINELQSLPAYSNDTSICVQETVQLNAVGLGGFVWSPSTNLSSSSGSSVVFSGASSEMIYVTQTDTNGCIDNDSILITVNPLPLLHISSDTSICVNDTLNLDAGVAADQYLWTPNVSIVDPTIQVVEAFPSITTTYEVVAVTTFGCMDSSEVTVTVNNLPAINAGLNDTLCVGDSLMLNAIGSGNINWTPADSISNVNVSNPVVWPTSTTDYVVELVDVNLCVNSDTVRVQVNVLPNVNAGIDTAMCMNDSIQLNASGAQDYIWLVSSDLDNPLVSNPWTSSIVAIDYIVEGIDLNGCINQDTLSLNIYSLPSIDAGIDQQKCVNDSIDLLATGALTYVWLPNNELINSATDNPTSFAQDTTEYVVYGTDINGCVNNDTMILVVNPLPLIDAGIDDTICFGDTVQLAAIGVGDFIWTPSDSISDMLVSSPLVWPSVSTEYITQLTDSNACVNFDTVLVVVNALPIVNAGIDEVICINDSIQLGATGALTYEWLTALHLSDPYIVDPWSYTLVDIDYVVEGTDINGCINQDTMSVSINQLPLVDAGPDLQLCINDSIDLMAVGANDYVWTPDNELLNSTTDSPIAFVTDTTELIVVGTDVNNCVNSDTIVLVVNPLPVLVTSADINICLGDSVEINASGAEDYIWSPSSSLVDFESDTTTAFPDTTVTYYLTAIDSNLCVNYDSTTVNVFRIYTINDTTICQYDSVQLNVFGSPGNVFNWTPNYNLTDNTIGNPIASPEITTTYVVGAEDLDGCLDQDSVTVTVNEVPIPAFGYSVTAGCEGLIVQIADSSSGVDFYNWTFSNGIISNEVAPEVTFDYNGPFEINLDATNNAGCQVSISQSSNAASFDDYYSIYIPNVFTPNDDGENDNFWIQVPGELSECLDVQIYNRWGQMMFKSFGSVVVWDGKTVTGENAPEGSYYFTIDIKDKQYQGTLQLFR